MAKLVFRRLISACPVLSRLDIGEDLPQASSTDDKDG